MNQLAWRCVLCLALVASACATPGGPGGPDPGTPAQSRDRIDRVEVAEAARAETVHQLVERRRPEWLEDAQVEDRVRALRGDRIAVFLDDDRLGGRILLHTIPTAPVQQVRYLSRRDAIAQGLDLDESSAGAIVVRTRGGPAERQFTFAFYPVGIPLAGAGHGFDAAIEETASFADVSSEPSVLAPLLGVRLGFGTPLAAELLVGASGRDRVTGVDEVCVVCPTDRENRWDRKGWFGSALVQYELGGVRVGAGPAVSVAEWTWERERCTDDAGCRVESLDALRVVSFGAVADVSYRFDPPIPRLFADVKLQGRYSRASPSFRNPDVETKGGAGLYLILGIGLR